MRLDELIRALDLTCAGVGDPRACPQRQNLAGFAPVHPHSSILVANAPCANGIPMLSVLASLALLFCKRRYLQAPRAEPLCMLSKDE